MRGEVYPDSTLPTELLATNTHDALSRHVLPPFYPPIAHDTDAYANTSATSSEGSSQTASTRSTRRHNDWVWADLKSPKPTKLADQLFKIFGPFHFVSDPTPPGEIVTRVLRPAQLPATSPANFIKTWNAILELNERAVWEPAQKSLAGTVPSYSQRSRGDLGGTDGVAGVEEVATRPENQSDLTSSFITPLRRLIDMIAYDSKILDEASTAYLKRYYWLKPSSSRTPEVCFRQPPNLPDDEWSGFPNFVAVLKIMPEAELHALVQATKRIRPQPKSSSATPNSSEPTPGLKTDPATRHTRPATGFTLECTGRGRYDTDADQLPSVFRHVLPSLVERFSDDHASLLLFGNYDAYVLITMKDNHTISVSDVFYRDPNMHPDVEVHPPGSEANPVLLEVIIAAILSTKGTMGEKPWPDMNVVRRAFWTDDAVQRAVTKLLNAESSKSATASASDSGTGEPTESDVAVVHALPQWSHGRHAKYNSLHCYINGDKVWKMRLSDSTDALFERLSASVEEPSSDAESICPTPSPPTQSAPQSPSSAPESSSDLTQADAVTLRLGKYLGTGKNYDVYAGTIDVRGKQFDVAFKYIDLTHYTKREDYDYGRTQFCRVHNDIKMMLSAHDRVPHVAPRFFGLWSYNESQYLLAIEHCGTPCDLTHVPTANEVRGIYLKLHAAGLRHNGLHSRHILRDNHGRIRIIDWEGGWLGTPHECGPEILGVERMIDRAWPPEAYDM